MADHGGLSNKPARALAAGTGSMNEFESKRLIRKLGIDVPDGRLLPPDRIDRSNLTGLRGPFAVKFVSREIQHKTELGAVEINVPAEQVAGVCRRMLESPKLAGVSCDGFLVEEMVTRPAQEMVLGGLCDSTFGPVVMLGIGGVFLEVLNDVTFRICPIDRQEVHVMLRELRGFPLLQGFRGTAPANLDALVDTVLALAGADGLLMSAYPDAIEIDVNPLLVDEFGATAVDAQVLRVGPAPSKGTEGTP